MKSARNQFILVGFLCQGLAWETPLYWLLAPLLWIAVLSSWARRIKMTQALELAALITGGGLAILAGKALGQSSHFFLGDAIVALQAARMIRPLSHREKLASVLMACFHVAVACTLAPDIRFFLLAIAALILLPKALVELQSEEFGREQRRLEWQILLPLAMIAVALFVTVPRFSLGTPIQLGSAPSQGGLLSSVLDPSSGGYANSAQTLLQIEGKNLKYLKAMALSEFDGERWVVQQNAALRPFPPVEEEALEKYLHRRVRVKNIHFLGRILPADAVPVAVRGKFFTRPFISTHGVIECSTTWNSANNQYEYWIPPEATPEKLSRQAIRYYTEHPPASARLNEWLRGVTAVATNQFEVAGRLERHLRANFTYRLGAPALNRLNSLEDFLFENREGHCERFASAMALLLRMHNIPSRIAIGYVPGPKSRFSDWRQVRFKDAHAWTEAWFPERGWVTFDATPGGGGGYEGFGVTQFLESIDLFWYSNVIAFDGATQKEMVNHIVTGMAALPGLAARNLGAFFAVLALGFAPWLFRQGRKIGWMKAASPRASPNADHFYAELLRVLARKGFHRSPQQTPLEFLDQLRTSNVPYFAEIEEITRAFCESHYGEKALAAEESARIREHLRAIAACREFSR